MWKTELLFQIQNLFHVDNSHLITHALAQSWPGVKRTNLQRKMAEEAAAAAEKVVEAVQEAVNGTQAKVDLNVNSRLLRWNNGNAKEDLNF